MNAAERVRVASDNVLRKVAERRTVDRAEHLAHDMSHGLSLDAEEWLHQLARRMHSYQLGCPDGASCSIHGIQPELADA